MSPEKDRTRDAVDSEPKHYQLSYSGPLVLVFKVFTIATGKLRVNETKPVLVILSTEKEKPFISAFFCFPELYVWVSPFWVIFFVYVTVFNPTIEVVTFCLFALCMLGVFLLPAFSRLGHEYQDLLSPCHGMHAQTRPQFILLSERVLGELSQNLRYLHGEKISSARKKKQKKLNPSPQGRITPTTLHHAGQRAQHTTNERLHPFSAPINNCHFARIGSESYKARTPFQNDFMHMSESAH